MKTCVGALHAPLLLGLLLAGASPSAARLLPEGRPALRVYGSEQGLPINTVESLALDAQGRLWAGTQDGAAVFDGRAWTPVDMPRRSASNFVKAILGSADGSVWFGTDAGLAGLQAGRWEIHDHRTSGLPDDRVLTLLESRNARGTELWVGTAGGLARLAGGVWTVWNSRSPGFPGDRVLSLAETFENGRRILWAGTDRGIARREGETWTPVLSGPSGPPAGPVVSLLAVRHGGRQTLWAGTDGGGLGRFDGRSWTLFQAAGSGLPSDQVLSLAATEGAAGEALWIGTTRGLVRYRERGGREGGAEWTRFDRASAGLPSDQVFCLLPMRQGETPLLWLGMRDGGVASLAQAGWSTLDSRNSSLPFAAVYSLAETGPAERPTIWLGTETGGIARWRDGRWDRLDTDNAPLPGQQINAFSATGPPEDPAVWIGTDRGLTRLAGGQWTLFTPESSGLPSEEILALLATPGGLWVGTRGGLALYREGHWSTWTRRSSGLPDDEVYALAESPGESGPVLWLGTRRAGLVRFENGSFTSYGRGNSPMPNDWVNTLRLVRHGGGVALWVGTDGGAARLDLSGREPRWVVLTDRTDPPLPRNMVLALEADARGRVYLLTTRGVARLTPRTAHPLRPADFELATFTTGDGLPSNEGNQGASMVDRQGRIWFGTLGGVAVLDPASREEAVVPPLFLKKVTVGGREVSAAGPFRLDHRSGELRIEYALRSYLRGEDTRYRIQLVGFEETASPWRPEPFHAYGRLPAGDYVFRVWGRDAWGSVAGPRTLAFTVAPAPWWSWWAWLGYAGLAGLALAGIVRVSQRALRRRNDRLEGLVGERTALLVKSERQSLERALRLADLVEDLKRSEEAARQASQAKSEFLANMSHEIRTPMNAVLGMTTVLGGTELTLEQREYVETIRTSGESLLALVNDLLDVSKIEAGMLEAESLPFALRRCVEEAVDLLAASASRKGLEIGCLVEEGVPALVRTDAARLRQILVNLLSNAVKFTPAGEVFLNVTSRPVEEEGGLELELTVRDTGIGIPPDRLDRLFLPFSQVDSSTTRLYGGTGLGLAISRRLTEMLGGRMWVTPAPERGTVFHFTVRCVAEDGPPPPYLEPRPPLLAGRRLLLVTHLDQPARIAGWYARHWGLEITEASSHAAALDRLGSGPGFDLALLDAALGDLEDLETACRDAGLPWVRLLPGGVAAGRSREPGPPFVARPIKGLLLHRAVLKALGHELPQPAAADAYLSAGLAALTPLRILVAEDNSVNQRVILLLLSQLGYTADMAANGLEVLAALRRQRYDLILMDVQMPEMDGLEAARRICQEWREGERPRIVAMTASARREDREACFAAGMDGYLSKPLVFQDLRDALRQACSEPSPSPPSPDPVPVLNLAALDRLRELERHAGRPVVQPIVESFLQRASEDLAEMREALREEDWQRLAFKAHTLKGTGLQIGADRLSARLQELETEGREGRKADKADEILHQIEDELRQAAAALEQPLAV